MYNVSIAWKNTLFFKNNSGRDYAINYTLDQLEDLLDPVQFFRINRKFVVSFQPFQISLAIPIVV